MLGVLYEGEVTAVEMEAEAIMRSAISGTVGP